MKNNIIKSVSIEELSGNNFKEIAEIEKDMWAYWIWEYVKCDNCNSIYSKNDIYWDLEYEIKIKTVTEIENILWNDSILCKKCSSSTNFIYDIDENLIEIKKRLFESKQSFISILYNNDNWDINWFIDWYVDYFNNIYERELKYHYDIIWKKELKRFIEKNIWNNLPENIFSFSSMWTKEKYKNFYILFEMIKYFFSMIPNSLDNVLWLTELDSWWSLNSIYAVLWAKKIDINWIINNTNLNYNSWLFYHKWVVADYKKSFSLDIRTFLKKYKSSMEKILVD